jgi:restriction endonuclease Mrr
MRTAGRSKRSRRRSGRARRHSPPRSSDGCSNSRPSSWIPNRIVLIDGRRLAELMILHNVGVQDESTFVLKRLDEDFFDL